MHRNCVKLSEKRGHLFSLLLKLNEVNSVSHISGFILQDFTQNNNDKIKTIQCDTVFF